MTSKTQAKALVVAFLAGGVLTALPSVAQEARSWWSEPATITRAEWLAMEFNSLYRQECSNVPGPCIGAWYRGDADGTITVIVDPMRMPSQEQYQTAVRMAVNMVHQRAREKRHPIKVYLSERGADRREVGVLK